MILGGRKCENEGRGNRKSRSAEQTPGLVAVVMAADDQFALLPVPRAQPVLVAAARDYAVHAGRPFQRYRARRRHRRIAVRATAVAAVLGRHRLDQRVHQVVQTVHVLDESGRPGEQQEQRHGQTLANTCKKKKKAVKSESVSRLPYAIT